MVPYGTKVRLGRAARGLSKTRLAEKANIDRTTVERVERTSQASTRVQHAIEAVFGFRLDAPEVEAASAVFLGYEHWPALFRAALDEAAPNEAEQ